MRSPPEVRLGFPFTEHDTPSARARIEADLVAIAQRAHAADGQLDGLVLTGGFSRGEGTLRDDRPVNDYDLIAIRSRPGGDAEYRALARDLHERIGLEVDLMPVWRARLPHVARKLFWLDARLGARVITGPEDLLSTLRAFHPAEVARPEIARLLGNRAAGLLLALPRPDETPDNAQRDLQATKAVLAAMDATLLHRGRYAARMRDRLALTRNHPDHSLFADAVAWKLSPHHALPRAWWERSRDALLRAVDTTRARQARDGLVEHALHAARAKRLRYSPSQAVRRAAWDLLAMSTWPRGPVDVRAARDVVGRIAPRADPDWATLKTSFFAARQRTLQ